MLNDRRVSKVVTVGLAQTLFVCFVGLLEWVGDSDFFLSVTLSSLVALQCVVFLTRAIDGPVELAVYAWNFALAFLGLQPVIWPMIAMRAFDISMYVGLAFCFGLIADVLGLLTALIFNECCLVFELRYDVVARELEIAHSILVVVAQRQQREQAQAQHINPVAPAPAA